MVRVVDQPLKKTLSVFELDGLVVHDGALVKHAVKLSPMPPPLRVVPE